MAQPPIPKERSFLSGTDPTSTLTFLVGMVQQDKRQSVAYSRILGIFLNCESLILSQRKNEVTKDSR